MLRETKDERGAARRARVIAAYKSLAADGKPRVRDVARRAQCSQRNAGTIARAVFGEGCFRGNANRKRPRSSAGAVLTAYDRLLRETGLKPTVDDVAAAAGVSRRMAHFHVFAALGKGAFGGKKRRPKPVGRKPDAANATDAEIAERILAAKADRPPLAPSPTPPAAPSLAEAAVRDYRRARRSLKSWVAGYSLLDARPA